MSHEIEQKEVISLEKQANELDIKNQFDLDLAGSILKNIKEFKGKIDLVFKPIIEQAYKAHKTTLEQKRAIESPVELADKIVRKKVADYHTKIENIERARLAEVARIEAENKRKVELAMLAEKANQASSIDEVVNIITTIEDKKKEELTIAPVPQKIIPTQKTEGIFTREIWSFEIIDASLLPREFLMPDEKAIKAMVTAKKDACNIPGIKVIVTKTTGVR